MDSPADKLPTFADLANLSIDKFQQLESTLASILASPAAQDAYAQLIDGTPTWQSYVNDSGLANEVTIVSDHPNPSDEAIQQYEEIRAGLTLHAVKMDINVQPRDMVETLMKMLTRSQLVQKYQNAPLDTREHDLRLLEITAASVNALAGIIYLAFHPDTELKPPKPSIDEGFDYSFHHSDEQHVNFSLTHYKDYERYPFGLLNVVGFWAEDKLFGGVLLFDRGESGAEINDAFIHPHKLCFAYRISLQQLADFNSLREAADVAKPPMARDVLPFTQEADAHLEYTFVRAGEPPLRIYKNDYDKQPTSYIPERPSCRIPFDEAWKIIEEKGWNKLDPRSYHAMASRKAQACPGDTDSKADEDLGRDYSEFERLTRLCSGKY